VKVILRGRLVAKSCDALCNDIGIVVQEDKILDVGRFDDVVRRESDASVREFDGAIFPGLINSHTHLELSPFHGFSHRDFVDWVLNLMNVRTSHLGENLRYECLKVKREAESRGTVYFVNTGNDFELNVSLGGNQLFEFEQIGINDSSSEYIFARSKSFMNEATGVERALAIHAPYSVSPTLMKYVKAYNNKRGSVTSIHLSETLDEVEFIKYGRGRITDLLNARVVNWKFSPSGVSPVQYVDSLGVLDSRTLCAHCVFVDDNDLKLLGSRGCAVAFCVRSNRELSGEVPKLKKFLENGIRILIGTDSRASSPDIDMLHEMSAFYKIYHNVVRPSDVFRMATSDAADFLGIGHRYGKISPGFSSSLLFLPFNGKSEDFFEFLLTDGVEMARTIELVSNRG
jgi:cytosine/adenosine deaminase-related metal-dependent hydrolase